VIEERLATAQQQLELRDRFDHVVENDDRERAAAALGAIIARSLDGAATMARQ
jgi:guanylate kinase